MADVVSISCTCDYLIKRAARHRRAGRYDEAMMLLWKARNQFGLSDELLKEMAEVYEAIGSDSEAIRAYLRIVRMGGKHRAFALFHLAVACAQQGDMQRAASYYEHLRDLDRNGERSSDVSLEMIEALGDQLHEEFKTTVSLNARKRAKALERRSAALLQAGKAAAAQRAMEHSLRLMKTARGYTMLSCCQLIRNRFDQAVASAEKAHEMSPGNVQALCVLADAYMACGEFEKVRRIIHLAALRAQRVDDLLSVAVESAKAGEDALTIRMTGRILRIEPFHTRAMMIRSCALINRKEYPAAKRLLGRLCGLMPEDSVCESYYRSLCAGNTTFEHLTLGLDVTRAEGVSRASELVAALYEDPKAIDEDPMRCMRLCRLCDWAFHSPMAGAATKTVALVFLASLESDEPHGVLLDLLMDPQVSDSLKLNALQLLTAKHGFHPYEVDMDGKLVRLAAGGMSAKPVASGQVNSKIVQRVSDVLSPMDPAAPGIVLDAFLAYLAAYGYPAGRHENVCTAALEQWYHEHTGKKTDQSEVAQRYGVSLRLMRTYLRRFKSCMQKKEQSQQGE